jgi:mono/diheme cytochrome c family protein
MRASQNTRGGGRAALVGGCMLLMSALVVGCRDNPKQDTSGAPRPNGSATVASKSAQADAASPLASAGGTSPTPITPLERGRYVANAITDCRACHTSRKTEDQSKAEGPEWAGGEIFDGKIWKLPGVFVTPNLTPDNETGLGSWTDAEIGRAIREGKNRKGERLFPLMPAHFFQSMADDDLAGIIAYLRSLEPAKKPTQKNTVMTIERSVIPDLPKIIAPIPLPSSDDPVARGKYIVTLANCHTCHSPTQKTEPISGRMLAGGVHFTTPFGAFVSANITPDPESGVGKWSKEDFYKLFRTGVRKGGAQLTANFMPWYIYKNMTDADLDAVIAYLRSIPAVKNDVHALPNQFQLGG